jgi:hypothetical protein
MLGFGGHGNELSGSHSMELVISQEKDLSPPLLPIRLLTSPGRRQFIPLTCCFDRCV